MEVPMISNRNPKLFSLPILPVIPAAVIVGRILVMLAACPRLLTCHTASSSAPE